VRLRNGKYDTIRASTTAYTSKTWKVAGLLYVARPIAWKLPQRDVRMMMIRLFLRGVTIGISSKLRLINHESRLGRFGFYLGLVSDAVPALPTVSDDGVGMCD